MFACDKECAWRNSCCSLPIARAESFTSGFGSLIAIRARAFDLSVACKSRALNTNAVPPLPTDFSSKNRSPKMDPGPNCLGSGRAEDTNCAPAMFGACTDGVAVAGADVDVPATGSGPRVHALHESCAGDDEDDRARAPGFRSSVPTPTRSDVCSSSRSFEPVSKSSVLDQSARETFESSAKRADIKRIPYWRSHARGEASVRHARDTNARCLQRHSGNRLRVETQARPALWR